jgi:hypothetical protein
MTKQPPAIVITDLGAPPVEPHYGFRRGERAILALTVPSASAPLVSCLLTGRADWSVLGLVGAGCGLLTVTVTRSRRDAAPDVPVSAPGWSATWSDYSGTVVPGERVR